MIILGIDPGLAIMGYGVIETDGSRHRLVQYGALTTEAKTPMPSRLLSIHTGVEQLLAIYKPDQIAFEELFFAKNVTTGIAVGEARGAALVATIPAGTPLYVKAYNDEWARVVSVSGSSSGYVLKAHLRSAS